MSRFFRGSDFSTQIQSNIRAMKKIRDDVPRRCDQAVNECARIILNRALFYVPVDTVTPGSGAELYHSGRVEESENRGLSSEALVVFGGVTVGGVYVDYAVYVHELTHLNHEPPTGAKYLSRAVNETRGVCTQVAARNLNIKTGLLEIIE